MKIKNFSNLNKFEIQTKLKNIYIKKVFLKGSITMKTVLNILIATYIFIKKNL